MLDTGFFKRQASIQSSTVGTSLRMQTSNGQVQANGVGMLAPFTPQITLETSNGAMDLSLVWS